MAKDGITITFIDGRKDWFDPVVKEERDGDIYRVILGNGDVHEMRLLDVASIEPDDDA